MKIIGIGLNKTGTKTLRYHLKQWGFRHMSFDLDAFNLFRAGRLEALFEIMQQYDSFEDWPWPLMFREIDSKFPEARFVLTIRRSPEIWYRSLCKMAVRMGPFHKYEQHIYGYAMPQGHRSEHLQYYERHNQAVLEYFRERPSKLLKICWETLKGARASRRTSPRPLIYCSPSTLHKPSDHDGVSMRVKYHGLGVVADKDTDSEEQIERNI